MYFILNIFFGYLLLFPLLLGHELGHALVAKK